MGGYGSGRHSNRQQVEDCKSLDANRMHLAGCFRPGWKGTWSWSRGGEEIGRVDLLAEETRLVLNYRVRVNGGEWEPISQPVPLSYVDCHFGGQRPYFRCPGVVNGRHCGRRVGKLFSGGRYFLCRHCYGLSYHSQSLDRADRLLRRANKARKALGGEPGTASWIPFKPKGMHQRTYERMRWQIERDEGQADQLFLSKYQHLLSREERVMYFGA